MKRMLVIAMLLTGCASMPELTRVAAIPTTNDTIVTFFHDAQVLDIWPIPGRSTHYLVFADRTAFEPKNYGPQLFVVSANEILFETKRMMDTAFVEPTFFVDGNELLMLANFGNEDSWGLIAIAFDENGIRDLGDLDVVREPDIEFYRSALPGARVFRGPRGYVASFDGVVFEEIDGRFVKSRRTRSRDPQ